MAPELHVRCLGRLSLHGPGVPDGTAGELPLPATLKAQSLLAYLVVQRQQPHSREQLAALFWGDRPERRARRSLSTALWQIHRCLPGDDYLLADAAEVQFNPHCAIRLDVAEFEALASAAVAALPPSAAIAPLQQAMELYRGDFLEGFGDEWVLNQRYRLENLYHDVLTRLLHAHEEQGEHAAVLAVALHLLARDPLREDAHRAVMRAYCQLGQRHAALAQYGRCQAVLQAELGIEPLAETSALRQAIVEGRLACVPEALTPLAPAPDLPRESARSPLDAGGRVPLVGRSQELAYLRATWQAALDGQSSLLLVSGEAGVGKTRLVQAFAEQQRWQGVRVLQGRCYEFERLLPYQPLAEALRALPQDAAVAACAAVPQWVTAQVRRLAPDLGRPMPNRGETAPDGAQQEQLFEAVSCFLARLAGQQPLLLILEDLHWAGDSTLQLLHYVARHLVTQPLLLVGTLRPEVVGPAQAAATLGRRLVRDGLARRLQLRPLSAAAVAALVEQLAGAGAAAQALAARLYRETEGNPFYLIETLKSMFEAGTIRLAGEGWQVDEAVLARGGLPLPSSVSEMIAARVGRLAAETQDAAQMAAVVGRTFDFDLLHAAWGQDEDATLAAVDDLLRQQLVVEIDDSAGADYAFTHHKIQEVIYAGLPRHRRHHLHARVGLALERLLGVEAEARSAELAFHFEQAQQVDRALVDKTIAYLLQAGQQAERQSAHQEAIAYVRRGLDIVHTLPETPQRLQQEVGLQTALALPTTAVYGYGSPEARRVYEAARRLCRQHGDAGTLFTALVGLTRYYGLAGDLATASTLAEQLVARAEAAGKTGWLVEAYRLRGSFAVTLGRLQEGRSLLARGLALYDPAYHERHAYRFGHDPAMASLQYLSTATWLLGYPEQARRHLQSLQEHAQIMVQPASQVIAQCVLAKNACVQQDRETALRCAEEGFRLGQSYGLPMWMAFAGALRGWALFWLGDRAGLDQLVAGTAAWRATGALHFTPFLLALQGEAYLAAQNLQAGQAAVADALAIAANGGDTYWLSELQRLRGELSWACGRDRAAVEACFREALETARRQEATMPALRAAVSLARLWQSQGRVQAAQELLAAVYGRFTEGFEAPDLQRAGALLAIL